MRKVRMLAVPVLVLVGATVLAGCGGGTPKSTPSTSPTGMMDDGMMSSSPTPSAMMSDDDDMMSDG